MRRVRVVRGSHNFVFSIVDETGGNGEELEFIQSDWEYAPAASALGWVPCPCGGTDGTVDCDHRTTSEMLSEAYDFLSSLDGQVVESHYWD